MNYQPIEKIPDNAKDIASNELKALSTIWINKREELSRTEEFIEFLEKLQLEWAIETGIIERLYTWDRYVTEILIEHGIHANIIAHQGRMGRDDAEKVKLLIDGQLTIVEGLFSFVKNEQPLTEHYIRAMHAQFTSHQKDTEALTSDGKIISVNLEKGTYKNQPNNPRRPDGSLHFYCPPEHVQSEMNNLIEWYRNSETDFAPEVRAAWLHHRFTQIHPFQDGNGRIARALATLVFLKAHIFPLVLRNSDRREYILALETADSGNLLPLINLFVKRQVNAILNALTLQQQIKPVKQTEKIISSAVEILKNNHSSKKEEIRNVYDFADTLFETAKTQFDTTNTKLNEELKLLKLQSQQKYYCCLTSATNDSSHKNLFYKQVVDMANGFNYRANLTQYNAWVCIEIRTSEVFEVVISIHSFGHNGIGIMAALALTTRRLLSGEDISEPVEVRPACTEHFQFNYAEPFESTKSRFENWLADSLVIALEDWKKQISI